MCLSSSVVLFALTLKIMEHDVLKIVIDYKWHYCKGITIFNATETKLQQKI
jgi:hypothetical protein